MSTRPTAPHPTHAPAQPALAALGIELHTHPVPAQAEHRRSLTPLGRIKAVRLFTDAAGWAAIYTHHNAPELAGAI